MESKWARKNGTEKSTAYIGMSPATNYTGGLGSMENAPGNRLGVQDKIVTRVGFYQAAFSNGLRYWSQNRPNCRFSSRQRMSRTFCAPETPQNMPDCLSLRPMTVLKPASTTPEPMNKPRARYSA